MKKILVAEDDRSISNVLSSRLKLAGYNVSCAYDGESAILMLKRDHYDLVLLDLIMPKKDGFMVMSEVRDLKIKVSIIVSSNLSQDGDFDKARKLGAVDFFVKSNTSIKDVLKKVKKVIGS